MVWSVLRRMCLEKKLAQAQEVGFRRGKMGSGWEHPLALWISYTRRGAAKVDQSGSLYSMGPKAEGVTGEIR